MAMDETSGLGLPQAPKTNVVIVGAGGHGRVVLDILQQDRGIRVAGFIDSNKDLIGRRVDGVEVLGGMKDLPQLKGERDITGAIVAIGTNGIRRAFAEELEQMRITLINAIHPSAHIAANAGLGKNIVIAAGAQICAHCQIGDSVILNTGCIVDHESMIGTAAHICPGARLAGRVTVEAGAFVGIGATVIHCMRIGYEAIVGAGAVVIHDVEPLATVVGVPARVVRDLASCEDFAEWLMPEFLREGKRHRQPPPPAKPRQTPAPVEDLKGR